MKNMLMVIAIWCIGTAFLLAGAAGLDMAMESVVFFKDPIDHVQLASVFGVVGFILFVWLIFTSN